MMGDFILVKFPNDVFFVAKVVKTLDHGGEYEVSYLRKSKKISGFVTPEAEDVACVSQTDIAMILPSPLPMATKRLASYIRFPINFGNHDVR